MIVQRPALKSDPAISYADDTPSGWSIHRSFLFDSSPVTRTTARVVFVPSCSMKSRICSSRTRFRSARRTSSIPSSALTVADSTPRMRRTRSGKDSVQLTHPLPRNQTLTDRNCAAAGNATRANRRMTRIMTDHTNIKGNCDIATGSASCGNRFSHGLVIRWDFRIRVSGLETGFLSSRPPAKRTFSRTTRKG